MDQLNMKAKKLLCSLLFLIMIIYSFPNSVSADQIDDYEMSIKCQYTIEFNVYETTISGVLSSGNFFVSLDTIAELTGFRLIRGTGDVLFCPSRSYNCYLLNISTGELTEIGTWNRSWMIPLYTKDDGTILVALDQILMAMNAKLSFNQDALYPLCTYLPYTIMDAVIDLKPDLFFRWTEADINPEDEEDLLRTSLINSIVLDYNDHFTSDVFFSLWNDQILSLTEEQYFDAFTAILTCNETTRQSIENHDSYKTVTLLNNTYGLMSDMLELMEFEDLSNLLGDASLSFEYIGNIAEIADLYYMYQSIGNNQSTMLKTVFIEPPEGTYLNVYECETVKNAAAHAHLLMQDSVSGIPTAANDLIVNIASQMIANTLNEVCPILAIFDATEALVKIFPPTAELAEINQIALRASQCHILEQLAGGTYGYALDHVFKSEIPDYNMLSSLKQSLLFRIKASIATRELLLQCDSIDYSGTEMMKEKNKSLLQLQSLLERCSLQFAPQQLCASTCIEKISQSTTDTPDTEDPNSEDPDTSNPDTNELDTPDSNIDSSNPGENSLPADVVSFNEHSYKLFDLNMNWHDAKEYCELNGGHLATINSAEEDAFLYAYIQSQGYASVVFGLSDEDEEDNWKWVTGEPFLYSNWHTGEPNHQGGYEHYGMYYEKNQDGSWNDGSGAVCPFLCEWDRADSSLTLQPDFNINDILIGTWDSEDGETRICFESSGNDIAFTTSGMIPADGQIEIFEKDSGELEDYGTYIILNDSQIAVYTDLEEYILDYSYDGNALTLQKDIFYRVDESAQDSITAIVGTWTCEDGTFTFNANGTCSFKMKGHTIPESGTYAILDEDTILINEPGVNPYEASYELNGDTLQIHKTILTRLK